VNTRLTEFSDIPALKTVLDQTGLFPSEMLPDMISEFLNDNRSNELWLTGEVNRDVVGFCYAVPEKLTEGTWNMLAIAVLPSQQANGVGGAIVAHLENYLRSQNHRVLIAETSGTMQFEQTRAFYRKCGYCEEARIRDFWAAGDDKIIFWKVLK
jgi:ribosomal protein S18 acetylase RimI-like enzyme